MKEGQAPLSSPPTLVPLSESAYTVDPEQDIRGRKAFDNQGDEIGTIDELFIDPDKSIVRFIGLKGGGVLGIGDRHRLLPVEAIAQVGDDAIRINHHRQLIAAAPLYQPELLERRHIEEIYGYYGYPPFWGPDYTYPIWYGHRG
jgi:hypothetical protein